MRLVNKTQPRRAIFGKIPTKAKAFYHQNCKEKAQVTRYFINLQLLTHCYRLVPLKRFFDYREAIRKRVNDIPGSSARTL